MSKLFTVEIKYREKINIKQRSAFKVNLRN